MDDTDYLAPPVRSAGAAWQKIHDELHAAGIEYLDASDGVEQLRKRAEHGSDLYDIIARTRSALGDEAGVAFQSAIADEVRELANERDIAVRDRDEFCRQRDRIWSERDERIDERDRAQHDADEQASLNWQLHKHCQELEEQLTQQAGREGRLIEHSGEQAQSCYFLRKHVHELESSLSAEKETVDDLQWKLEEERHARQILRRQLEYEKQTYAGLEDEVDRLSTTVDEDGDVIRAKDDEIERLNDALREAESKASLRRTLIDIVQDSRDKLRDELNEVREEAAAEGMSRRQAENTLAEIQDEVNGCPPSDARVEAVLDRHYGRKQSGPLAKGHSVRVVSSKKGVGHKGELGVVCQVHDDEGQTFPFRVRFEDGDWREYKRDELERV